MIMHNIFMEKTILNSSDFFFEVIPVELGLERESLPARLQNWDQIRFLLANTSLISTFD